MRMKITLILLMNAFCFHQIYAQCDGADFEEKNGIAILELDSKVTGSWRKESISGASGGSALTYRGTDYFNSPGNSTISYKVKINSSGTYRFIWRNKISVIANRVPTTEHNDSWLKISASNFFGQKGNSRIYPGGSGKSPTPEGASSGGWFKVYTNTIDWSWSTKTSDNDAHLVYATFNSPGVYTIQVSARSNGHSIDRMVLYKEGSYSSAQAESLSRAVTSCSGSTPTPPPTPTPTPDPTTNVAPSLTISSPTAGQNITAGTNVTVGLSASDSDGSIAEYQVFLNNTIVDTDGSSYTPYVLTNIQPGTYTIRAVVTDNGGKTTSKSVTITVDNSGTPTPNPTPTPTPPSTNSDPSVSITNLTNGQRVTAGSNVAVNLQATDSDGSVVKYQIFVNNVLVDTDGAGYTPHIITGISTGNYEIKATVTDNDGNSSSTAVNIIAGAPTTPPTPPTSGNVAPTVQFISLTEGQVIPTGQVALVALTANDSDGTVTKYQVYVNGVLVDTDGASYTSHPFQETKQGNYLIRVVVTDNEGATGTAEVNVVVGSGSTPTNPTPPAAQTITFNLINALSNTDAGALTNGASLSASKAQGINIRANVPSEAKSVLFTLSGPKTVTTTENFSPYALFQDVMGNYNAQNLSPGAYILTAAAYAASNGSGSLIANTSINFTVSSVSSKTAIAFPNPVSTDGKVSIRLPEGTEGQFYYKVANGLGVQVEQGNFNAKESERNIDLELSNIGRQSPGIYYLTLFSRNSQQTIPIIRK